MNKSFLMNLVDLIRFINWRWLIVWIFRRQIDSRSGLDHLKQLLAFHQNSGYQYDMIESTGMGNLFFRCDCIVPIRPSTSSFLFDLSDHLWNCLGLFPGTQCPCYWFCSLYISWWFWIASDLKLISVTWW